MSSTPDQHRPIPGDDPAFWPAYYDAVAGFPPRDTLLRAADEFDKTPAPPGARLAIDLGCGHGRDSLELLRRGWRVIAIDSHPDGLARLRASTPPEFAGRLQSLQARYEDAEWPACHLVNASVSIPHCTPTDFPALWAKITASILPGGRFAGQLFGIRDEWATKPGDGVTRTYHSRQEVEAMLAGFEPEFLDEVERPGKTAAGEPKYWHIFHIVARKR